MRSTTFAYRSSFGNENDLAEAGYRGLLSYEDGCGPHCPVCMLLIRWAGGGKPANEGLWLAAEHAEDAAPGSCATTV
jgi:hypothetical protein